MTLSAEDRTRAVYWGNPKCPFCGKAATDRGGHPKGQIWWQGTDWMTVLNTCGRGCSSFNATGYDTAYFKLGFDRMPKPEGDTTFVRG